jgi:GDP-4-dehydro-6-deoxy-D-mannose reductase
LKNKVLITGCASFIGSYLAEFLLEIGFTVYGTIHQDSTNIGHLKEKLTIFKCDILDKHKVESIVAEVNPDFIFHLAAQSLILPSWQDPEKTLKVNTLGTLYLLESIRKAAIDPVIEVVGSSAEYGFCDAAESPIKESGGLRPSSPYGVSKVAEDMLAYIHWQTYGMKIIRVRPFYIAGPRKASYVCSDFAIGITEIEAGKRDTLSVGNLDAVRDLVDVRDAVRAMWLIVTKGTPGEVYNICSGKGYRVKDILDKLISLSSHNIKVCTDPDRMRPSDEPILIGDISRLRSLGWEPQISIDKTLADILDYWRTKRLNG